MKVRSSLSALLIVVPLTLEGREGVEVSCTVDTGTGEPESSLVSDAEASASAGQRDSSDWLGPDEFSAEQLEAEYQRAIGGGLAREVTSMIMSKFFRGARSELMIPVVFLAAKEAGEAEVEGEAEDDERAVETPEEMRIEELELENATLRARLSRVETFVDPDWPPVQEKPKKRRFLFRPRQVRPGDLESRVRPPLVAVYRPAGRFKPFTRAAMDTQMSGWLPRARAQSLTEQRRFFRNASKALGAGVASEEYRGVRLEVQEAMLRGELTPHYAVQYLADVVDIFRTYERMERFRLTDGVAPPMSADSFRRNPDFMFTWASEVNEQKRKLNRENSPER